MGNDGDWLKPPDPGRQYEAYWLWYQALHHGDRALAIMQRAQRGTRAPGKPGGAGGGPRSAPLPPALEAALLGQEAAVVAEMIRAQCPDSRGEAQAFAATVRDPGFAIELHTLLTIDDDEAAPPCEPAIEGSWTEGM